MKVFMLFAMGCVLAGCTPSAGQPAQSADDAKTAIRAKIDDYTATVGSLDMEKIATVWATTPEVSFIQPRGEQHGWDEISNVFYGRVMGENFTERHLQLDGEPSITVYGDSAVALFQWVFDATRADNGEAIQTRGRETQVLVNIPEQGWRIVHVHYSGPPVTAAGEGF